MAFQYVGTLGWNSWLMAFRHVVDGFSSWKHILKDDPRKKHHPRGKLLDDAYIQLNRDKYKSDSLKNQQGQIQILKHKAGAQQGTWE